MISFSGRFPIFCWNYWKTNLTFFIYIWVIYFCFKTNLRWFERIFWRKVNFNSKSSFVIRCIILDKRKKIIKNQSIVSHKIILWKKKEFKITGTISPVHCKILVSSTIISLKDFKPAAFKSDNSWKYKKRKLIYKIRNITSKYKYFCKLF